MVEIPKIRVGKSQTIETLINEEALLFSKFLRYEMENWFPRISFWNSENFCVLEGKQLKEKYPSRKLTFNDIILLIPLLGRIVVEFQDKSKRNILKRLFFFMENTLLYYSIGLIGKLYYPPLLIYAIILVFLGITPIEYFLTKRHPKSFGADNISSLKWYQIIFFYYHMFWYCLAGYFSGSYLVTK